MNPNSSQASLTSFGIRNESSSTSSSSRSTSISASQASSYTAQPNSNFRSISLIDCIQFKFDGNLSKNGVVLADCDNDAKNELLVGTLNGELLIFKDSSTIPLATAKDLGMISCVVVGDILNKNKNVILTISIEGYLNIFAFIFEFSESHSASLNPTLTRRSSNFSAASVPVLSTVKLPPTITDNEEFGSQLNCLCNLHCQQIQANAMAALIADIDGDGQNELIVALSDRVVRSYRAIQYAGEEMKLVGIHKWEFSDQIGSITLSTYYETAPNPDIVVTNGSQKSNTSGGSNVRQERKSVLVAQHGGMFAKLHSCEVVPNDNLTLKDGEPGVDDEPTELTIGLKPEYKNITSPQIRNLQISAEIISDIVGNSKDQTDGSVLISVATSDGLLLLLDEESIRWQVQLEQKIGSLCKHDMDNDGRDELVVCTWNGQTYFVNLDGCIVSCLFGEPVSAFTVGHYHLNDYRMTCLVYGTFTNSVYLYYNIECSSFNIDTCDNVFLDHIRSNNLALTSQMELLVRQLNEDQEKERGEMEGSTALFKMDSKLVNAILYGIPTQLAE